MKKSMSPYPKCPKCNINNNIVKNGSSRGKARYRCTSCKYDFIPKEFKKKREPNFKFLDLKLLCIILYYCGFQAKDLSNHIINLNNFGLKNYKIIYQWISEFTSKNVLKRNPIVKFKYIDKKWKFNSAINDIAEKWSYELNNVISFSLSETDSNKNITLWKLNKPTTYKLPKHHPSLYKKEYIHSKINNTINSEPQTSKYSFYKKRNGYNFVRNEELSGLLTCFIEQIKLKTQNNTILLEKFNINSIKKEFRFYRPKTTNYIYSNYFPEIVTKNCNQANEIFENLKWQKQTRYFSIAFDDNLKDIEVIILARK